MKKKTNRLFGISSSKELKVLTFDSVESALKAQAYAFELKRRLHVNAPPMMVLNESEFRYWMRQAGRSEEWIDAQIAKARGSDE